MSGRKGRRLAVALSPMWPRWGSLAVATFATLAWVGILLGWFYFAGDEFTAHRTWSVVVIVGGMSLACVFLWVRTFLIWLYAGATTVEISRDPLSTGQDFEYCILQNHSSIRTFEATILCRRTNGRAAPQFPVAITLAAPEIEPQGRRAMIRGTLKLPDGPPSSLPFAPEGVFWAVEVRTSFRRSYVHKETFPFWVVAPDGRDVVL